MMKDQDAFFIAIENRFGVNLAVFDNGFLDKQIQKTLDDTHCTSLNALVRLLGDNNERWKKFYDSLHIGYSEFFRNPLTFAILEKVIIPELFFSNSKKGGREIRVWSAACSAGQEAYSLAMLFEEIGNGKGNKVSYRIFATDLSQPILNVALSGIFSTSMLKNITLSRLDKWFINEGDNYLIKEELKVKIDFSVFNLLDETRNCPPVSIFGGFDMVVCSNLLIYNKPKYRKQIIDKIISCLSNGGYLITGEAERDFFIDAGFIEVFTNSAIFKNKNR
jgi:chemotaxis methyl-accepting protein methylase